MHTYIHTNIHKIPTSTSCNTINKTSISLVTFTKGPFFYQNLIGWQQQTADRLKAIHEAFLSEIRDASVQLFVVMVLAALTVTAFDTFGPAQRPFCMLHFFIFCNSLQYSPLPRALLHVLCARWRCFFSNPLPTVSSFYPSLLLFYTFLFSLSSSYHHSPYSSVYPITPLPLYTSPRHISLNTNRRTLHGVICTAAGR